MPPLTIDVVSDVVCPWCLIGTRRLELALEAAGESDATVTYHPFVLDPSTPREGADLREHLRRKYGNPEPMFARVEAAARESGIPLDFTKVRRTVQTLGAHTLLRHAVARGTQRALAKALFGAYFLEGRDVGDEGEVAAIASAHGFSANEAVRLLRDEAERAETRAEAQAAARRGMSGVPFTIVNGRYGLSGAQPVEVFERALRKARAESPR